MINDVRSCGPGKLIIHLAIEFLVYVLEFFVPMLIVTTEHTMSCEAGGTCIIDQLDRKSEF